MPAYKRRMTDTTTTTTSLTHYDNTGNVGLPQVGNSPPLRSDESNTFANEMHLPNTSAPTGSEPTTPEVSAPIAPTGKIETVIDKTSTQIFYAPTTANSWSSPPVPLQYPSRRRGWDEFSDHFFGMNSRCTPKAH